MKTLDHRPATLRHSHKRVAEQWTNDVRGLVRDVNSWAAQHGWATTFQENELFEEGVGAYIVPTLTIETGTGKIILEPSACRTPDGRGRVDLYAYPSFARILLIRDAGPFGVRWRVQTTDGIDWPSAWNESTFIDLADRMLRTL